MIRLWRKRMKQTSNRPSMPFMQALLRCWANLWQKMKKNSSKINRFNIVRLLCCERLWMPQRAFSQNRWHIQAITFSRAKAQANKEMHPEITHENVDMKYTLPQHRLNAFWGALKRRTNAVREFASVFLLMSATELSGTPLAGTYPGNRLKEFHQRYVFRFAFGGQTVSAVYGMSQHGTVALDPRILHGKSEAGEERVESGEYWRWGEEAVHWVDCADAWATYDLNKFTGFSILACQKRIEELLRICWLHIWGQMFSKRKNLLFT